MKLFYPVRMLFALFLLSALIMPASAQENRSVNGVRDQRMRSYALVGAKVYVSHDKVLPKATLVIKGDEVLAVGTNVEIPQEATVIDMLGSTIYPGFIDLYSSAGIQKPERKRSGAPRGEQMDEERKGAYGWNEALKADYDAVSEYAHDANASKALRSQGFTTVLSHRADGVVRGSGTLVLLNDKREEKAIVKQRASAHFSFSKGTSTQSFPGTILGGAALLRQTYYDSDWYSAGGHKEMTDQNLEAFAGLRSLPAILETNNRFQLLLGAKIGKELSTSFILKGNGDEYQRLPEIKSHGSRVIIPLNFPGAYDVKDPFDAMNVSLSKLKHWELAPYNALMLHQEEVPFAFTSSDLSKTGSFLKNLRAAVKKGLPEAAALKALTTTPAEWMNEGDRIGKIAPGYLANFVISKGDLLGSDALLLETWVAGERFVQLKPSEIIAKGRHTIQGVDQLTHMTVAGKPGAYKFTFMKDSVAVKGKATFKNGRFTANFADNNGAWSMSADYHKDAFKGYVSSGTDNWKPWNSELSPVADDKGTKPGSAANAMIPSKVIYPFVAYGNEEQVQMQDILIKNATVWTNTDLGILKNHDVLIKDGKITKVGKDLNAANVKVIDGTGKHLTTGIIDEHSHIGLFSVNEYTQAVTAEVRMEDAINPDNIHIYRQLAGGVTTSQLLHGSANPIGGQSAIVKLKWGGSAEDMVIDDAPGFIKFALGENVKQSNRRYYNNVRYPQTRMGVEQIIVDGFARAREYQKAWDDYNALSSKAQKKVLAPRKDLELEALAEIINKERFITCHSYVQSEINMLMKVAEQFGFRINTFTHILEGYKLADIMAEHGAAGSTFSDWWAYKYEVKDAIPYNASLMTEMGVLSAINSDDAEMGRRLNQEAAKSVKYGGMSEEDAWKLVTLNPAKMLHLDHRLGSMEEGKDADLVLWSDNPLSIYAKAEKTIIEGKMYYDVDQEAGKRKAMAMERKRLINAMLHASNGQTKGLQKVSVERPGNFHCDHMH